MIQKFWKINIAALMMLSFIACNDKGKSTGTDKGTESQTAHTGFKMAFIDVDSMQSSLDYFKSKSEEFVKEESAIQNELAGMQRNLQTMAANLSKRVQNKDISDVEIQSTQKKMENSQISMQRKGESLGAALMKKQMEFNNTLHAMLDAFTEEYNKEVQYDVILTKSGAIYCRPEMNITSDFAPKFNEWINKKLTDQAMMKSFQSMGAKENNATTSDSTQ